MTRSRKINLIQIGQRDKEIKINKLIVLDVEGTIRCNFADEQSRDCHYHNLMLSFEKLKSLDCEIVIASNLESKEYPELKKEFQRFKIDQYISHYEPKEKPSDGRAITKIRKLKKYIKEYAEQGTEILPSDVRFYDDSDINLLMFKLDGFMYNYLVNNSQFESSLVGQLLDLIEELESAKK